MKRSLSLKMGRGQSPSLVAGLAIVGLLGGLALLSVFWTPYDPLATNSSERFASPTWRHILGTDQLGRDVLSIAIEGARTSLLAALAATSFAIVIGTTLGIFSAVASRWIDGFVSAMVTAVIALPALLLALVFAAARGPSTATAVTAIGIATGASVAAVTRFEVDGIMRAPFVLASRFSGASTTLIVRRHVLRNLAPTLAVQSSGAASIAIIAESTLAYLGLGTPPPTPSWGRMLSATQQYLLVHPLLTLWPAVFVCVAVLGFNLLGDGLRERLDPTLTYYR
jgi:peptide/nickel transport system permease protein